MSLSFSDMILAFVSSLCLYLMIEAPVRKIFKELLMPTRGTHAKEVTELSANNNNNTITNNYPDSRL